MPRRSRSREIEIFNFSFLDVLACTIGLLIFIMVMAFVLQAGSPVADTAKIVRRRDAQIATLVVAAERDSTIASTIEAELDRVVPTGDPDLIAKRAAVRALRDAARDRAGRSLVATTSAQANLSDAQNAAQSAKDESVQAAAQLAQSRQKLVDAEDKLATAIQNAQSSNVILLPRKRPGDRDGLANDVYHVDCQPDRVVIFHSGVDGALQQIGLSTVGELATRDSDFQKAVAAAATPGARMLFWIRPAGTATFESAKALLPSDVIYGYDPADTDWVLQKAGGGGGS